LYLGPHAPSSVPHHLGVFQQTVNELLRGRTAYSDGWVVDRPWLDRLYESASMRCEFTLSSLEMILSVQQMDAWATTKQHLLAGQDERRHRASYDALVVQETFQRTRGVAGAVSQTR